MDDLEKRLVAVEERIVYAERTIDDLSDVLRGFGERIDAQNRLMAALRAQNERLAALIEDPRAPEDEKPPHY